MPFSERVFAVANTFGQRHKNVFDFHQYWVVWLEQLGYDISDTSWVCNVSINYFKNVGWIVGELAQSVDMLWRSMKIKLQIQFVGKIWSNDWGDMAVFG